MATFFVFFYRFQSFSDTTLPIARKYSWRIWKTAPRSSSRLFTKAKRTLGEDPRPTAPLRSHRVSATPRRCSNPPRDCGSRPAEAAIPAMTTMRPSELLPGNVESVILHLLECRVLLLVMCGCIVKFVVLWANVTYYSIIWFYIGHFVNQRLPVCSLLAIAILSAQKPSIIY